MDDQRGFYAPRSMLAKKPAHGSPCTQCGLCCVATLCELGRDFFGKSAGPCPALVFNQDGDSACGLTLAGEPEYRDAAKLLIGAGDGCDARFNGEPGNPDFYALCEKLDAERADDIAEARGLWSMPALDR